MHALARGVAIALLFTASACSGGGKRSTASSSGALNPFASRASSESASASSAASTERPPLHVGQCFDVDVFQSGVPIDPNGMHLSLCARPHQHEVIATFVYPDAPRAPWPGVDVLDAWASDHCVEAFPAYVGIEYDRSHLDVATVRPNERSWKDGDRAVACAVHDVDFALLTGSVKGTAK